ncbi:hypothetical protein PsAD46_04139 [Pseudovibrio sp. Ad46]|nr:hypothetical protein PsAD46_04139 [Pseudovibrio sp. Ad46]
MHVSCQSWRVRCKGAQRVYVLLLAKKAQQNRRALAVLNCFAVGLVAAREILCDRERLVFQLIPVDLKVFRDALHVVPRFPVRD